MSMLAILSFGALLPREPLPLAKTLARARVPPRCLHMCAAQDTFAWSRLTASLQAGLARAQRLRPSEQAVAKKTPLAALDDLQGAAVARLAAAEAAQVATPDVVAGDLAAALNRELEASEAYFNVLEEQAEAARQAAAAASAERDAMARRLDAFALEYEQASASATEAVGELDDALEMTQNELAAAKAELRAAKAEKSSALGVRDEALQGQARARADAEASAAAAKASAAKVERAQRAERTALGKAAASAAAEA
eukprot:6618112-Prymnesium_polylepis.1